MRLFVAVRPSAEAVAHAAAAVAAVRADHPGPRWIPPERWHLTLAFYGEIPDENVAGVTAMVARKLTGTARFELAFAGSGVFPRRALWLGVDGDLPALRRLARSVTFDRRPYRPHLTVARLRGGADPEPAREALRAYAGPAWRADAVHLIRSQLGPHPTYTTLATFPLA